MKMATEPAQCFHLREIGPDLLLRERRRMVELTKAAVPFADVAEIGSTAVPGVLGKQDIDVMVRVRAGEFDMARAVLDEHFPRNGKQISNSLYQGYVIDSPLDAAIQLIVAGSSHDRFEQFVALLARSHDLRSAYNELKRKWDGHPMVEYRAAKSAFIEAVLGQP